MEEIPCPNHHAGDEKDHCRAAPAETAPPSFIFSAAEKEDHPQRQGKERRAVELGQQHSAQQDSQNRSLSAGGIAPVAQGLHCAGKEEQAAHAVDGGQRKMRDQVGRKNRQSQNEVSRGGGEEPPRRPPQKQQKRHAQQDIDRARTVKPHLRGRRHRMNLVRDEIVLPIRVQQGQGEQQTSQRRLVVPVLEFSEAPCLEPGDQMLRLVVGKRLGADKPCALSQIDQNQQRN